MLAENYFYFTYNQLLQRADVIDKEFIHTQLNAMTADPVSNQRYVKCIRIGALQGVAPPSITRLCPWLKGIVSNWYLFVEFNFEKGNKAKWLNSIEGATWNNKFKEEHIALSNDDSFVVILPAKDPLLNDQQNQQIMEAINQTALPFARLSDVILAQAKKDYYEDRSQTSRSNKLAEKERIQQKIQETLNQFGWTNEDDAARDIIQRQVYPCYLAHSAADSDSRINAWSLLAGNQRQDQILDILGRHEFDITSIKGSDLAAVAAIIVNQVLVGKLSSTYEDAADWQAIRKELEKTTWYHQWRLALKSAIKDFCHQACSAKLWLIRSSDIEDLYRTKAFELQACNTDLILYANAWYQQQAQALDIPIMANTQFFKF